MKYPLITIILFLVLNAIGLFIMLKNPVYVPPHQEPDIIELTNTDTIYQEIEVLKLKQDTIKLYYEKKINIYRALPTPERVELFAKRINQ